MSYEQLLRYERGSAGEVDGDVRALGGMSDYDICHDCGEWHRPKCAAFCPFCNESVTGGGICGLCAVGDGSGNPLTMTQILAACSPQHLSEGSA